MTIHPPCLRPRVLNSTPATTPSSRRSPTAAGKVTVLFTVEKKTGKILDVAPDPARTTAPQSLVSCVITAINGLVLNPPDQRDGKATFEYDFSRPAGAAAPN